MITRHLVDVHVLLTRRDEILLSLRRSGDEFDARWHLPAGKLEAGEPAALGAVREAREEVGVEIAPADLRLVHTAHVVSPSRDARLGLFFHTERWRGTPENREPDKSYELRWFPLDALPDDLIRYPALGIRGWRTGVSYSDFGWPE
ncbi:NUDIX domain-containing protein [Nocardia sp. NPDC050697]|uniref:NUDIX hydrolase n=1 Tax=Nocardia sp. NPDC050697 TaxID=3155158 RepID=UPI0033D15090